jgi:hypothetical protein
MITFTYQDRGFQTKLRRLHGMARNPRGLMSVLGREAANHLKRHFRDKDRSDASALGSAGGRRQHFWLHVSRSVQNPVVSANGRRVIVSINDPRILQKVYGGTIRPKRAKMLAIPIIPEAYGRSPSVYQQETGNQLAAISSGANAVLGFAGQGGFFTAVYVLKRSVTQRADPTALPDESRMTAALIERGERYVLRTYNT